MHARRIGYNHFCPTVSRLRVAAEGSSMFMSSGRIRPDEDKDNPTIAGDSVEALDVEIQDIVSHV